ncbi:DUF742 domain-containing protein [Streptomyces sp. AJS327]|uniref:DUF742 domain-containing protein n=1 Tax=Streptomyces sp. AJS327 TaxID=2545265 RepID=UPI0015E002F1|nr:DUF742 domain-containing protein [Streptomyces sp. AJS327]MBA0051048.1 DUF742 domain-containing protein [Streptomyces sp. AJS327]
MTDRWFDDAAGPVVRPYAMTRGRTRGSVSTRQLDLIAVVVADPPRGVRGASPGVPAPDPAAEIADVLADRTLAPEHVEIVRLCRRGPLTVAELAAELGLPIGVVRVFIGDLMDTELVRVSRPVPPAELPDESILREVINGLRAL